VEPTDTACSVPDTTVASRRSVTRKHQFFATD
jgi:hypothetical protein